LTDEKLTQKAKELEKAEMERKRQEEKTKLQQVCALSRTFDIEETSVRGVSSHGSGGDKLNSGLYQNTLGNYFASFDFKLLQFCH